MAGLVRTWKAQLVSLGGMALCAILGCKARDFNEQANTESAKTPLPTMQVQRITIDKGASHAPQRALALLPQGNPKGVLFWFHGFQALNENYSEMGSALAATGLVVVLPQAYEPGNPLAVPPPAREADEAKEFIAWFLGHSASFRIPQGLPILLAGHSRGSQVALRLIRHDPRSYVAVALFDPVDGLAQFGQTKIFSDNWSSFHVPALIVGTEFGSAMAFPRMPCAPMGGNHFELAKSFGAFGKHLMLPASGHDDVMNSDVVAKEARNLLACRPGTDPAKNFATIKELFTTFFMEKLQASKEGN